MDTITEQQKKEFDPKKLFDYISGVGPPNELFDRILADLPPDKRDEINSAAHWTQLIQEAIREEEEQIEGINKDLERLAEHRRRLRNESGEEQKVSSSKRLDTEKTWREATRKYKDASKFYTEIISKTNQSETSIPPEAFEELTKLYHTLRNYFNALNSVVNRQFGGDTYASLLKKLETATEGDRRKELEEQLAEEEDKILEAEAAFSKSYEQFIRFEATIAHYRDFATKEVREQLEKGNVNLEKTERTNLDNSGERLARVKFLIHYDKYRQMYLQGKPIPVTPFKGFESFYNSDSSIDPDKFPEFFEKLTGIEFKYIDQENDIKSDVMRQMLTESEIKKLDDPERLQLKIDLQGGEELVEEEKKQSLLSSISLIEKQKDESETRGKRLKRKVSTEAKRATDPYLNGDPIIQERAGKVASVIDDVVANGKVGSLLDLRKLPSLDSMRPSIRGELGNYAREKFDAAKKAATSNMVSKIEGSEIGSRVLATSRRAVINIADKSKFVKKHRKRAKKAGLNIFTYIIKKALEKTIGRVVDVAKISLKTIRNTQTVARLFDSVKGSPIGQRIQTFSTGALGSVKDMITKGNLVYRNVVRNPIVVGAMDAGYITKTALKKVPKGLIYGTGMSSIALSFGISSGALVPIFIGGSLVGIGIDTVNEIMNSPMKRVPGRFIQWIQSHGSAIYRNAADKAFSADLIKNSKAAMEGKTVNVLGTRAGRIFGAMSTGLSAAMIAATIAGFLGINPLLAAGITFGTVATAKYAAQSVVGRRIAARLASPHLSRLGMLPLNKLIGHVFYTKIFANLIQELVEWLKSGGSLKDFFEKNFMFGINKGFFENFNTFSNYLGTIGFFGSYSGLLRFVFGRVLGSRLASLAIPGFAKFFGTPAMGVGLRGVLVGSLRSLAASTLLFAASSLAGLAIAAALGIPIGGIGAVIGATVGGLLGTGIGLVLGQGIGSIPLALALNAVGTAVGAWIGSFFDKAVDRIFNGLFSSISAISLLFTLVDILNNKTINPRRLAMMSVSLALSMPAIGAIVDKGSHSQVQADPTLPTPTVVVAIRSDNNQARLQIVNRTSYELNEKEVEKISTLIKSEVLNALGLNTYLIFSDTTQSNAIRNDDTVLLTVAVQEQDPVDKLSDLITDIKFAD